MTDIRDIYQIRDYPEVRQLRLENEVTELNRRLETLRLHYHSLLMYTEREHPDVAQIFREAEGGEG